MQRSFLQARNVGNRQQEAQTGFNNLFNRCQIRVRVENVICDTYRNMR
jgi:hypothetical protein